MENRLYELLEIKTKDDLGTVSKKVKIRVPKLRKYAQNMVIPSGEDAKKIQQYLGISDLVYRLKLGDIDLNLKEKIAQHASEIAELFEKETTVIEDISTVPVFETELGKLYHDDSIQVMKNMPDESVDLVFADPPFNLGKDYESRIDDKLSKETYLRWTNQWVKEAVRIVKPGGSVFIWNLPKWNVHISNMMEGHLTLRHWVAVDMKYGLPINGKLYPSHYSLLYYVKGSKPNVFNPERIPLDVCHTCGHELKDYGGYKSKMNPKGVNLSDVWNDIYPVRHSKYKNRGSNELPLKLLDRIISIATNPGDTVFDPFGGSGTTYAVAEILKRKWIGSEIGPVDQIIDRLKHLEMESRQIDEIHSKKNHLFLPNIEALRRKNGYWLPEDFEGPQVEQERLF
ncbi:site-specific DNA-methyltransferase [Lactiplantibacillus plantarum]|uniref:DNA-methyltransferase n=1 Tax=Lactiplantibacillus plantarum TaxID=1590 RepID=UPI0021A60221|nr:site-specific DNA-methyltransferase [Lactiplantibacillus plantarum]MCT3221923.1 site-specific DNA-methyltransferase [Lactiplantibacillus plantarum]